MDFAPLPDLTANDTARFFQNVLLPTVEDTCWTWVGGGYSETAEKYYGAMPMYNGGRFKAHRIAFYIFTGRKPRPDRDICHKCDNRKCVNPDHLFEGTRQDNILDCVRKGRAVRGERKKGDDNPDCKLSNEAVALMRTLYATGFYSGREITKWFDVARSLTHRILTGRQRGSERVVSTRRYELNQLCFYAERYLNVQIVPGTLYRTQLLVLDNGVCVRRANGITEVCEYLNIAPTDIRSFADKYVCEEILHTSLDIPTFIQSIIKHRRNVEV